MTGLGRFARGKPPGGSTTAPPSSEQSPFNPINDTFVDAMDESSSWMSLTNMNDDLHPSVDTSDFSFLADFGLDAPVPQTAGNASGGGLRMFHSTAPRRLGQSDASSETLTDDRVPLGAAVIPTQKQSSHLNERVPNKVSDATDLPAGGIHAPEAFPFTGTTSVDLPSSMAEAASPMMQGAQQVQRQQDSIVDKANHGAFQSSSMKNWTTVPVGKCNNPVIETTEESIRIIPGPPTLEKRSQLIKDSSRTPVGQSVLNGGFDLVPTETQRKESATTFSPSETNDAPEMQTGGGPSPIPASTTALQGFKTPGLPQRRSGTSSLHSDMAPPEKVSTVTPQQDSNDVTLKYYSLEASSPRVVPGMQFGKAPLIHAVTPTPQRPEDCIPTPASLAANHGLQENTTNDDEESMSFEELNEKYRSGLQDLDDNQDANAVTLLKLQDMFATAYGQSLEDQACLLDMLSSLEKLCAMGDVITTKYDVAT